MTDWIKRLPLIPRKTKKEEKVWVKWGRKGAKDEFHPQLVRHLKGLQYPEVEVWVNESFQGGRRERIKKKKKKANIYVEHQHLQCGKKIRMKAKRQKRVSESYKESWGSPGSQKSRRKVPNSARKIVAWSLENSCRDLEAPDCQSCSICTTAIGILKIDILSSLSRVCVLGIH